MPTIAERPTRGVDFTSAMVRAIMAGKKTQTRRFRQIGKVGDVLYVKEAVEKGGLGWAFFSADSFLAANPYTGAPVDWPAHWTRDKQPPMFMPRRFARTFIEITAHREEPLQDISEEDAIAEGATPFDRRDGGILVKYVGRWVFRRIWDDIYAKKPEKQWDANPTVHIHAFRVVREEEGE